MTKEDRATKFITELHELSSLVQEKAGGDRDRAVVSALVSYLSSLVADGQLPLFTELEATVSEPVDKKGMN